MATVYCFDTSALLDAGVRSYPRATFRSLWEKFETLIETGRVIAPEDVLEELKRKDDDMAAWGKKHRAIFVPLDEEIQERVQRILADFPRLVDSVRNRSAADPFVIALAHLRGASLVTAESPGSPTKPKIPNACAKYGIPCLSFLTFIQAQRWTF